MTMNSLQRCQVGLKLQTQQDNLEVKYVRLVRGFPDYLACRWCEKWESLKKSHLQERLNSLYDCRLGLQGEWLGNSGKESSTSTNFFLKIQLEHINQLQHISLHGWEFLNYHFGDTALNSFLRVYLKQPWCFLHPVT